MKNIKFFYIIAPNKKEAERIAKIEERWNTKFNPKWRQKNKKRKNMAKASRRANR